MLQITGNNCTSANNTLYLMKNGPKKQQENFRRCVRYATFGGMLSSKKEKSIKTSIFSGSRDNVHQC